MPDAQPSFWSRWSDGYEQPDSNLSQRLSVVQERVREAIESAPGPLRLISVCAGQGRDAIGVLAGHPRRSDVKAFLVELDDRNVSVARRSAADADLDGVEVVRADASLTAVYRDAVPADVLLLCGIFGNVSEHDVRTTVANASRLCAPGPSWSGPGIGRRPTRRPRSERGSSRPASRSWPSTLPERIGSRSAPIDSSRIRSSSGTTFGCSPSSSRTRGIPWRVAP